MRARSSSFPFSGTTCFTVGFLLREVFVQVLENFSSTAGFTRSQMQTSTSGGFVQRVVRVNLNKVCATFFF